MGLIKCQSSKNGIHCFYTNVPLNSLQLIHFQGIFCTSARLLYSYKVQARFLKELVG